MSKKQNSHLEKQEQRCVWMEAGVISYKLCDNGFDCESCPLDQALMQSAGALRDSGALGVEQERSLREIRASSSLPLVCYSPALFYDSAHFWLKVEEKGRMRLGIDDFAQQLLGRVYGVELPESLPGSTSVRLTNQLGDLALPIRWRGEIVWRNSALEARPGLINRFPFSRGSLLVFEPTDLKSLLGDLIYGAEAEAWLRLEADRLGERLQEVLNQMRPSVGFTANDGGEAVASILGLLRQEVTFLPVIESFLKAIVVSE